MKYLIRGNGTGKKARAHLWNGTDTACKLFSTGGLNPKNYSVTDNTHGLDICLMCGINYSKGKRA